MIFNLNLVSRCNRIFNSQLRCIVQSSFARTNKSNKNANLPFKVTRTPSGNLAVYTKIRAHGTVQYTVVRHIYGDIQAMKEQLRILCESPVRERVGSLEVQGIHVKKIKKWLVACGFASA
ncbi:mitochondrial large subunit ribosomal protein [Theileria orientalis strain Shintoku]|uniref:Large ribosomal subunit protein mL49 n=1 Tax=Theileria orientalis strain Shintoku TaxID=869250 RepID=J4DQ44_THEOR|nr:mitochondrial large subunit ribosomal protein [Theileria orientalis strain Shintoku]BAM41809.1 mitochondrial large subunit ribosomal protein [Theileria orientalis strain Shintoku]|eukprot:XP_009692110.1 mitochondrial large subunit ribosomal protein [Theileria orientalis strain Shintoku]